jgi:hypothetical protein
VPEPRSGRPSHRGARVERQGAGSPASRVRYKSRRLGKKIRRPARASRTWDLQQVGRLLSRPVNEISRAVAVLIVVSSVSLGFCALTGRDPGPAGPLLLELVRTVIPEL